MTAIAPNPSTTLTAVVTSCMPTLNPSTVLAAAVPLNA
jgi:hypothetical protein